MEIHTCVFQHGASSKRLMDPIRRVPFLAKNFTHKFNRYRLILFPKVKITSTFISLHFIVELRSKLVLFSQICYKKNKRISTPGHKNSNRSNQSFENLVSLTSSTNFQQTCPNSLSFSPCNSPLELSPSGGIEVTGEHKFACPI